MRVPDAVQREAKRNGAPLIRDRSRLRVRNGPGSAPQHSVLRCARDTVTTHITQLRFRVLAANGDACQIGRRVRDPRKNSMFGKLCEGAARRAGRRGRSFHASGMITPSHREIRAQRGRKTLRTCGMDRVEGYHLGRNLGPLPLWSDWSRPARPGSHHRWCDFCLLVQCHKVSEDVSCNECERIPD